MALPFAIVWRKKIVVCYLFLKKCVCVFVCMCDITYTRGDPKNGIIKKMELSSEGQAPCSTGFPLGECSRNPSVPVYQLALL